MSRYGDPGAWTFGFIWMITMSMTPCLACVIPAMVFLLGLALECGMTHVMSSLGVCMACKDAPKLPWSAFARRVVNSLPS